MNEEKLPHRSATGETTMPDNLVDDLRDPLTDATMRLRNKVARRIKALEADNAKLRERLGPYGLEVVLIDGAGHYVNVKVKAEIERLREAEKHARSELRLHEDLINKTARLRVSEERPEPEVTDTVTDEIIEKGCNEYCRVIAKIVDDTGTVGPADRAKAADVIRHMQEAIAAAYSPMSAARK